MHYYKVILPVSMNLANDGQSILLVVKSVMLVVPKPPAFLRRVEMRRCSIVCIHFQLLLARHLNNVT